jgi:hypothetical protein
LAAPAELVALLEQRGYVVAAPGPHPMTGVSESRWIAPAHLVAAAAAAKAAGYFFESLTCVDRLEALGGFELIYTFNRWDAPARLACRVLAARDQAVPSLTGVYRIAEEATGPGQVEEGLVEGEPLHQRREATEDLEDALRLSHVARHVARQEDAFRTPAPGLAEHPPSATLPSMPAMRVELKTAPTTPPTPPDAGHKPAGGRAEAKAEDGVTLAVLLSEIGRAHV